jgi:hypothetical protein
MQPRLGSIMEFLGEAENDYPTECKKKCLDSPGKNETVHN